VTISTKNPPLALIPNSPTENMFMWVHLKLKHHLTFQTSFSLALVMKFISVISIFIACCVLTKRQPIHPRISRYTPWSFGFNVKILQCRKSIWSVHYKPIPSNDLWMEQSAV